ncbi:MAG: adenosine nucleotide hydrolase [Steroidobacteraceae bacterium]
MTATRCVCSSSGGKDSLLAFWYARQAGLQIATQLTMFDENGLRSRSHGIPRKLVERQAEALGVGLMAPSTDWKNYERVFVESLTALRSTGHEMAVFGDTALQAHFDWETDVCARADMKAHLPLWQRDTGELARESIALGFKAIVVCVDSRHLSDDFCGRPFDAAFLADLPSSVDPCGENGEFHTFVHDGPLFGCPVGVRVRATAEYVAPAEFGRQRYCLAELAATAHIS